MSRIHDRDDALLERFVAAFSRYDEDVVPAGATISHFDPAGLGVSAPDYDRALPEHAWRPVRLNAAPHALEEFRRRLPGPLPPVYERLISSYRWREVELGELRLLANLPDESGSLAPLLGEITRDPIFVEVLLPRGLVPFGKGPDVNYDPLCFDLSRRDADGDCPVLRLDHEAILCNDRVVVVSETSATFRELVNRLAG